MKIGVSVIALCDFEVQEVKEGFTRQIKKDDILIIRDVTPDGGALLFEGIINPVCIEFKQEYAYRYEFFLEIPSLMMDEIEESLKRELVCVYKNNLNNNNNYLYN